MKVTDESRATADSDDLKLTKDIAKEKLAKDIEELNSKLNLLELNLNKVSPFLPRLNGWQCCKFCSHKQMAEEKNFCLLSYV